MTFDDYIHFLEVESDRFAAAVAMTDPATVVPTCPQWSHRELALHLGEVHRWAALTIEHPGTKPPADVLGPLPDANDLEAWLRRGSSALVDTLRDADPNGKYFTFLADPPSPLTFWARRQAHETAMHRVDAQISSGMVDAYTPEFAADGVDELLTGFIPRPHMKLRSPHPLTLQVVAADVAGAWHLSISPEPVITTRGSLLPADCVVRGTANDILLALWNRTTTESVDVSGQADIVDLFCDSIHIRWG